jgi:hypothetical protein
MYNLEKTYNMQIDYPFPATGGAMYKYDSPVMILGIFVLILSLIGAAVSASPLEEIIEDKTNMEWVPDSASELFSGTTLENSEDEETLTLAYEKLTSISLTLTWTDEDPSGFGQRAKTNEPDSFGLGIESPSGAIVENSGESSSGSITLTVDIPEDAQEESGDWVITISCFTCGDVYGPGGIMTIEQDDRNDWSLNVKINYEEYREVQSEDTPTEETLVSFSPAYRIYRFLDPRI